MATEILLAIKVLEIIAQQSPWIIEMIKDGRAAEIDWNAIRPKDRAQLELEVDREDDQST